MVFANAVCIQDAGGVELGSGARLRSNRVFRISGMLVTNSQLDELANAGIEAVVDMRGHQEARQVLVDWSKRNGVAYYHVPMDVGDARRMLSVVVEPDAQRTDAEIRETYRRIVSEFGEQIVATMRVMARYRRAAFGCAGGRDRTGIVAAFLQSLLGASDATIVRSYLSAAPDPERRRERIREWAGVGPGEPLPAGAEVLAQPRSGWLLAALAHVRGEHGSVAGYLAAHGLEPDIVPSLARVLVVR